MFIPLASGKSAARISAAYLISVSLLMSACVTRENAEYPHAVGVKTVLSTVASSTTAADSTSSTPQVNALAATLTPHSDDMLQSFERASMKMDQLHRQKGEWSF
ncbi:hypothetical protein [Methylomonas sp. TEB]|uniref:hypothetical protein n=1 Tax=Methylomonas sp. TEB TaxID=3398229 RepID=UPI0039F581EE